MKYRKQLSALTALGLAGALTVAAPGDAGTKNGGTGTINPCGTDGIITWSPTSLWPPNHKAQDITVTYTDPDATRVTLTLNSNPHNEILNGEEINGTGNTPSAADSTPVATNSASGNSVTVVVQAVAERSGHKNADGGRVYLFDYDADSDEGVTDDGCESSRTNATDGLRVFVPHDQGKRPGS